MTGLEYGKTSANASASSSKPLLTLFFDGRTASYPTALDYQAAGEGHELLYTERQDLVTQFKTHIE